MKINKLTASFGKLENETLSLHDGLNVIYAPNESGKSTWCAFIMAMLYGVDSSERARAGYLPDKLRYAPWSGAPMEGSMELTADRRDITITRRTRTKSAPMRDFTAVYTGSSVPVKELNGSNAGEMLTGVSKDVFRRSAFIAQGTVAVSGSPELEKRINAIVSTGEESGSFGAKSFRKTGLKAEYVIVGEPTGNKMVSACKGTKSFEVTLTGKGCHSGYPEYGISAVDMFVDFVNELRGVEFPDDTLLGATTWNIGKLSSVNPQNILSPSLSFRIYFRTTFASDAEVCRVVSRFGERDGVSIKAFGGDTPMNYTVLDGFETTVAAFGSDAPQLEGFEHRCLCGPGSILVAHTMDEHVLVSELEKATDQYVRMFEKVTGR